MRLGLASDFTEIFGSQTRHRTCPLQQTNPAAQREPGFLRNLVVDFIVEASPDRALMPTASDIWGARRARCSSPARMSRVLIEHSDADQSL